MSSDNLTAQNVKPAISNMPSNMDCQTRHCYEINLQGGLGGGEIYTRFFTHALVNLGCRVSLITKRGSWLANNLRMTDVDILEVDGLKAVPDMIKDDNAPVFAHTPFSGKEAQRIRQRHRLIFFAHMPLYGRNPAAFQACDLILAVSGHVIDSLKASGLNHYHPEPLYGVADLTRGEDTAAAIHGGHLYDWDTRKVRDRLLGVFYPVIEWMRRKDTYHKRAGLTLGIVSRLTPIKQFPLLFQHLTPIIAKHPSVNIEIFGSGGYASVRDLRRELYPIRSRVRYWGHQKDVRSAYRELDFLLTGLPEKEALGLNVLEAQACGLPVLAVDAPPFTETVLDSQTGYLYADPRSDAGQAFDKLLSRLNMGERPQALAAVQAHLQKFSYAAFRSRVQAMLQTLSDKTGNLPL